MHLVQQSVYIKNFPHLSSFILTFIFLMHGETLQNGRGWPGRKICTFYIFVLCTALLILNPIIYYLNPSVRISFKRSLCVYVNNTQKKKKKEQKKGIDSQKI